MNSDFRGILYVLLLPIFYYSQASMSFDILDKFKWKNRLLVVDQRNKVVTKHFELLKQKQFNEWNERKLKLIFMTQGDYKNLFHENPKTLAGLIGLDGELKKKYASLPSSRDIFTIIDTMPMRKNEMKNEMKNLK